MQEQGSLYHFVPNEVPPPSEVWNRIALELDAVNVPGALGHLAEMEVEPPPEVWQKIERQWDKPKTFKRAGINNRTGIFLSLAVAAALSVIVFLALFNDAHKPGEEISGSFSRVVAGNDTPKIQNLPGYAIITGINGNPVRLSPKLGNMAPFFSKTNTAPPNIWYQKLGEWTATVHHAVASPMLLNFADPVDLGRFLQNKK